MKTTTIIPTLLAIAIHAVVIGQTQGRQPSKIRVDIMGSKKTNSTVASVHQASNVKIDISQFQEVNVELENQLLLKKIEASQLLSTLITEKFEKNKLLINELLTKTPKNTTSFIKGNAYNTEAEHLMKTAKEMREEANAQATLPSKYANMTNAEENEVLALNKQQAIFVLFQKTNSKLFIELQNTVYIKHPAENANSISYTSNSEAVTILKTSSHLDEEFKQANSMKHTAELLRTKSNLVATNEKKEMLKEAGILEKDYKTKEINASNLNAKLVYEKFDQNRILINTMMANLKNQPEVATQIIKLNTEAEMFMKMGKELREEANAQLTAEAILGEISNAEEKETLGVTKQNETMSALAHTAAKSNYYATK